MSAREAMEGIWRGKGVRCATHVSRWEQGPFGEVTFKGKGIPLAPRRRRRRLWRSSEPRAVRRALGRRAHVPL